MKKSIVCLIVMFFCSGCAFMSPAPKVVQDTFYKVHEEMGYGGNNKEWAIPPEGESTWLNYGMHGTCSNFASLYRLRLNQAGIAEDRMRFKVIYVEGQPHAVLIVDDKFVLDNMRSAVVESRDIYLYPYTETELDKIVSLEKEKQGELVYFAEKQKHSTK